MIGMAILGLVIGIVLTLVIVGSMRRSAVNSIFSICLGIAIVLTLLNLLTGHGVAALGDGAAAFIGEVVGVVATSQFGRPVINALSNRN